MLDIDIVSECFSTTQIGNVGNADVSIKGVHVMLSTAKEEERTLTVFSSFSSVHMFHTTAPIILNAGQDDEL